MQWLGPQPTLCTNDAELVRQILSDKFGRYVKGKVPKPFQVLLGEGLSLVNGEEWVRHRKVVSPAFTMDKVKVSVSLAPIIYK